MCCIGAAASFSQISCNICWRNSRRSLCTLILISSCDFRPRSISRSTASDRPLLPTMTVGPRPWLAERRKRTCLELSSSMMVFFRKAAIEQQLQRKCKETEFMKRTRTSKAWMQEHVNDEFVKRANKEGYRSRAAYKLIELDQRDRLIRPGMTVVDLGAAP